MKKIQFSTVQKSANIEVVEVNSYLIARVVRASVILDKLEKEAIKRRTDDSGNEEIEVSRYLEKQTITDLLNFVNPLIKELENGFIGEEKVELKYK